MVKFLKPHPGLLKSFVVATCVTSYNLSQEPPLKYMYLPSSKDKKPFLKYSQIMVKVKTDPKKKVLMCANYHKQEVNRQIILPMR